MMNMMLSSRNSKVYKALSVVLAVMIVALSLPFSTSATVSQDMKNTVLEREAATAYNKDEFTRIYIGSEDFIGWDDFEVHAVSADELAGISAGTATSATDTDPKNIGQVLEKRAVYRTDIQTETQVKVDWKKLDSSSSNNNDFVLVYYVDVPKSAAGIFACLPGGAFDGSSMATSTVTSSITDGEFYYVTEESAGTEQSFVLKKAVQPSLAGFTVDPATRVTFCRGDKIPFAFNRSNVVSPIGNDFVYRFYYYKQGETNATELKQEVSDTEPYWISQEDAIGVSSEAFATTEDMDIGQYFVYMTATDGYTTYRSADVKVVLDPVGELTAAVVTDDDTMPIYNKNGVIYYGINGVKISVHASEVAQVAYMINPSDADLESQTVWPNTVTVDPDTGLGEFTVDATAEVKQNTPVTVVVRGYNAAGDLIKDGVKVELVCDLLAPKVTDAKISSNDGDVWKQVKALQFVIEDLGSDTNDMGSGVVVSDKDKLYLENTTTGRKITETKKITETSDGRSVTVEYEIYESGTYVLHYCDYLGTADTYTVNTEKIDRVAPEITVADRTQGDWVSSYEVKFTVNKNVKDGAYVDGVSDIIEVGYAEMSDGTTFENATKTALTPNNSADEVDYSFNVNKAGKYAIYARDEAGNETVKYIDLQYIDNDAPTGEIVISSDDKTTEGTDSDEEIIFQDPTSEEITVKAENVKEIGDSGIKSVEYFFDYNYVTNGLLTTSTDVKNILNDSAYDSDIITSGLPTKGIYTMADNADRFVQSTVNGETVYSVELAKINKKVNKKFVVYMVIIDNAGNETLSTSNVAIIDSEPPKITADVITENNNGRLTLGSWYNGKNGKVHIRINSAEDDDIGSGIAVNSNGVPDITYVLEYKSTKSDPDYIFKSNDTVSYPFTCSGSLVDGEYNIVIYAKDNAGNIGEYKIENIQIDTVVPEVTISSNELGLADNNYDAVDLQGEMTVKIKTGCSGYGSGILQSAIVDNPGDSDDDFENYSLVPNKTDNADGTVTLTYTINKNNTYRFKATSVAGLTGISSNYEIDNIKQTISNVDVSIKYPDNGSHAGASYNGEWTDENIVINLSKDGQNNKKKFLSDEYKYNYIWQYATSDTSTGEFAQWKKISAVNQSAYGNSAYETFKHSVNINTLNNADHNKYYKFRLYVMRSNGKYYTKYESSPFLIKKDTKKPTISKPTYEKTLTDQILEVLTFGWFSTDDIDVTLHANDAGSGVTKFHYTLNGVNGSNSAEETNTVTDGIKNDSNGNASYTFRIRKEYMGTLTFSAEDALGHRSDDSSFGKDEFIVIDSAKPESPTVKATSNDVELTSGKLVNKPIKITVTPQKEPSSGVEGFYMGEDANDPSSAVKLSTNEVKENRTISLKDNKTLDYTTVTSVEYNTPADINKTYYFFTKSNAGKFSEPQAFTFNYDGTSPKITKFEFNGDDAETVETDKYGLYFNADTTVKIYATDDFDTVTTRPTGSGVTTIVVWLVNSDGTENEAFGKKTLAADANGCAEVTVPAEFKGNIYAYALDAATNQSETKHPYATVVESNNQHQKEEHVAFVSTATDKFANETTNLTVNVTDTYSGIKNVEWSIVVDGDKKAEGTAATDINGDVTTDNTLGDDYKNGSWTKDASDINLVTKISRTFALAFDSNDVVVNVTMTDNAGNTTTNSYSINIDKTKPVVTVSYDNNNVRNNKYFKEDRTITIDIDELNFDDSCASKVVVKMLKDGADYSIPTGFTKNSATGHYTLAYTLGEGVYSLVSVTCTDLAGNSNEGIKTADGTKAPVNFVIDKTKPVVTVAYDNQSNENGYFKADRTVTVTVEDFALQSSDVDIEATLGSGKISINKDPFVINDAAAATTIGKCTWTYKFDKDGEYTFNVNKIADKAGNEAVISYGSNACPNEFIIDKTAPKVNVKYINHAQLQEPYYFKDYREAQITVTEKNFDPARISANITAVDRSGAEVSDEYISNIKAQLADISKWTSNGSTYTQTIKLGMDDSDGSLVNAIYHFGFILTDKAGNKNTDIDRSAESGSYKEGVLYNSSNSQDSTGTQDVNTDFVIDGEGPENLQIEVKDSTISKILNVITGGIFFKETVDVVLTAEDKLSGVSKFVYTLNYDKVEGSSVTDGNGITTRTIESSDITYDGNKATATFKIAPQFRGYISFYAVDRAASESQTYDPNDKQVVVDDIPPVVSVTFDNNNGKLCAADGKTYYNRMRTATVKITETNFFAEDIAIKVNGSRITPDFTKNDRGSTPIYTAEYAFTNDGEYDFTVEYNDRSGNAANINNTNSNKFEEKFIIDTIAPIITVSYDNNNGNNGYYGPRTATIRMKETNFVNRDDVKFSISAWDVFGDITAPVPSEWTIPVAGVSTSQIKYDTDGNYSFGISYSDPAGNPADIVMADGTQDGEKFCIDTEAPYNATVSYNDSAFRKFINTITGGLVFKDTVTVKVRVDDKTSGIERIEYICDVADGASKINTPVRGTLFGGDDRDIEKLDSSNDSSLKYTYEAQFNIDPNYRGKVKVLIYDNAGNVTDAGDTTDVNELIVDNKSPEWGRIQYAYSGSYSRNGVTRFYFNKQITGSLEIDEANFDKNTALSVKITKDGVNYDASKLKFSWTAPSSSASDKWTAKFTFGNANLTEADNGEYIITLNYTDVAGNKAKEYVSTPLVIDTVKPKFEVSYDNNDVKNDKYFPNIRTATLVITEPNIKSEDIDVKLTATNPHNPSIKAPVISEWKTVGNKHTATIIFDANAQYKLDIKCSDLATNSIDLGNVEFGTSKAGTDFVVDKVAPTGSITVGNWSASVNGTVWDKIISTITFGLYTREDLSVTIKSDDNLSGVNKVEYFVSPTKLSNGELRSKTNWQSGKPGSYSFTISKNNQFIVYAKITDKADNVKYISTDGIIIDQVSPKIDGVEPKTEISLNPASDTPEINANGEMLFNGNIVLDVKATDVAAQVNGVDVYSGLQSVTYQVISNGVETQSGTLTGEVNRELSPTTGLVHSQSDTITINADRNNTNDIRLVVTAIDNVGNRTVNEQQFMIDTTPPEITVTYDNDSPDPMGAYYKAARTATITITERNFNPNKVSLTINTVGGTIPRISEWTTIEGSTPDDTRHRATLVYSADGDYTFDMTYTDEAGNKAGNVNYGSSVTPREFTIDRTLPVIAVSYDNNNASNGNYFNASRTATIMIVEHNFETSRIVVTGTASDDGLNKTFPRISGWSTSGDNHYATITFTDDAEYKFTVSYTDKAGNNARATAEQNFFIDNINPVITVDGVENSKAYGNGSEVAPTLTFTDKNFDPSKVKISLKGAKLGDVDVKGSFSDIVHGKMFTFDNIEAKPENDDIYTLTANVEDLSGRTYVLPAVKFSVNRFGSTYEVADDVKDMTGKYYVQRVDDDVVIIEYNVDAIEDYVIEVSKNGNTATVLSEGTDFKVTKEYDSGSWAKYTYIINKSVFDEEGSYAIVLKSKDAAENSSYSDLANTDLKFVVDRTVPTVVLSGITSGGRYKVEAQTVKLLVTDDNRLGSLKVIINGTDEQTWTVEELEKLNGEVTFTLQNSNDAQSVQVICVDAAGNEKIIEVTDVIISTSSFVQIYNNRVIFYGVIGVLAAVLIISFIIILIKRRKKDDEEEITVDEFLDKKQS